MTIPLRVLIVEDSEDDTILLLRELRRGGYDPTFKRVDTPEAMSADCRLCLAALQRTRRLEAVAGGRA